MLLKKNVVATNIYGDTLQTDELWWDQNAEKFYTDKKVIFSKNYRNDYFIGLKGMTCNENLTDLRLFEIEDKSFFIYKDSSAQSTPAPPPVLQQRKK